MDSRKFNYLSRYKVISKIWNSSLPGRGTLSRFLTKMLIPKPTEKLINKTIYDFDLLIDPSVDSGVEGSLYYFGTYERGTLGFIKEHLKAGEVFFDIGANIGLMSIFSSYCVGRSGKVYAFEANPDTAKILEFNISLNTLSNITVIQKAVGNTHDRLKIYNNGSLKNRGGASLIKPEIVSEYFDVELIRIDEIVDYSTMHIAMVKIDVEGFELDVLKGMEKILQRNNPPKLIIECSADRNNNYESVYEMVDYIRKCNTYKIFKLSRGKERSGTLVEITANEDLPKHDNIFCIKK